MEGKSRTRSAAGTLHRLSDFERAYFEDGKLAAERLVGDALLLKRLIYPNGLEPGEAAVSAADHPEKTLERRAEQAALEIEKN